MRDAVFLLLALALPLAGCGRSDPEAVPEAPADSSLPPLGPRMDALPAGTPGANGTPDATGETWNAAQIDWQPYEAGLARAKAQNKPLCLVLYTGWCPHCRNYARVFDDAKVVERARSFVMVRANADDEPGLAAKFSPDGGYIPRTFFLGPDGTLDPEIHAPRPKFRFFYDEHSPAALLGGMAEALRKLVK